MTQTNYKAMTDNELNTVSNELHDESLKCLFKYKQAISNLIKKYMPNCYLESLYNNTMTIGFNEHDGWFRNLSITIYFGIDCWAQEKGFKFQINPSSIGTFNIFDDCEEKAYYVAIGTILSNNEFNLLLHGNLKHFYEEYLPIEQEIYAVCDEIRKRENEKKKAEEERTRLENERAIAMDESERQRNEIEQLKKKLAELDSDERPVILTCPICGNAFVRIGKAGRKTYCGRPECNKRRRAQNTRNCRKRQKIAEIQTSAPNDK